MWHGAEGSTHVKESTRWVEGYEIVADLAAQVPNTRLVYVADREGDLRELMAAAARRGHPADWLVRAKHNRPHHRGGQAVGPAGAKRATGRGGIYAAGRTRTPGAVGTANAVSGSGHLAARKGAPAMTVTAILAREEHPLLGRGD